MRGSARKAEPVALHRGEGLYRGDGQLGAPEIDAELRDAAGRGTVSGTVL